MPHLLRASKRGSGPNRTPRPTHQIQECEQLVVRSNFRLASWISKAWWPRPSFASVKFALLHALSDTGLPSVAATRVNLQRARRTMRGGQYVRRAQPP